MTPLGMSNHKLLLNCVDHICTSFLWMYLHVFLATFELHLSRVRSASEETMAVLEEVIMLAFQQCVYYITKVRGW